MGSFDELKKRVIDLEKQAQFLQYSPADMSQHSEIEVRHLPFSDLSTELDKLYKVKAAKKYLK